MNLELRKTHAEVQAIIADRQPLPVELLLEPDKRRVCSVAAHEAFRLAIATKPPADPIDEAVAEMEESA